MDEQLPSTRALVPLSPASTQRGQRMLPRVDGGFLAQIVAVHLREGDQRRRARPGCARAHGIYRRPAEPAAAQFYPAVKIDVRL